MRTGSSLITWAIFGAVVATVSFGLDVGLGLFAMLIAVFLTDFAYKLVNERWISEHIAMRLKTTRHYVIIAFVMLWLAVGLVLHFYDGAKYF